MPSLASTWSIRQPRLVCSAAHTNFTRPLHHQDIEERLQGWQALHRPEQF